MACFIANAAATSDDEEEYVEEEVGGEEGDIEGLLSTEPIDDCKDAHEELDAAQRAKDEDHCRALARRYEAMAATSMEASTRDDVALATLLRAASPGCGACRRRGRTI